MTKQNWRIIMMGTPSYNADLQELYGSDYFIIAPELLLWETNKPAAIEAAANEIGDSITVVVIDGNYAAARIGADSLLEMAHIISKRRWDAILITDQYSKQHSEPIIPILHPVVLESTAGLPEIFSAINGLLDRAEGHHPERE